MTAGSSSGLIVGGHALMLRAIALALSRTAATG
jgi:hypothetical protein